MLNIRNIESKSVVINCNLYTFNETNAEIKALHTCQESFTLVCADDISLLKFIFFTYILFKVQWRMANRPINKLTACFVNARDSICLCI